MILPTFLHRKPRVLQFPSCTPPDVNLALGAVCTSRSATPRWPMHDSDKAYANGQELFVAAQ